MASVVVHSYHWMDGWGSGGLIMQHCSLDLSGSSPAAQRNAAHSTYSAAHRPLGQVGAPTWPAQQPTSGCCYCCTSLAPGAPGEHGTHRWGAPPSQHDQRGGTWCQGQIGVASHLSVTGGWDTHARGDGKGPAAQEREHPPHLLCYHQRPTGQPHASVVRTPAPPAPPPPLYLLHALSLPSVESLHSIRR